MAQRAVGCYEVIWDGPKTYHIDKSKFTMRHSWHVLVNGHLSEWFQVTVDNRQGVDPLSPRSFALFPERIMDKIKHRENSGNRVNNLRFADDIDIIEQSNEKLQDTESA